MAQARVGMAADVSVLAMTADLGAEIRGVDLSAPLSDACFQRIDEALRRYCVIFLRGQRLDPRLLVRFALHFGETEPVTDGFSTIRGLPQVAVINDLYGYTRVGGLERYGRHWRTDGNHRAQPISYTMMYAVQHPTAGGGIEFANQYAACAALPRTRRLFLEKLRGIHPVGFRRDRAPRTGALPALPAAAKSVEHPLVRRHPLSGEKALYAGRDLVAQVLGLVPAESRRLLDELEAFATQPRFIYSHEWRQGDLLVWDNRCTLHRLAALDRKADRVFHRVQVAGEAPLSA